VSAQGQLEVFGFFQNTFSHTTRSSSQFEDEKEHNSFSRNLAIEEYLPQCAFLQAYGSFPRDRLKLDYAAACRLTLEIVVTSIHPTATRRLTLAEQLHFTERGFIKPLPLFAEEGVVHLQQRFDELLGKLPDGIDINRVNCWQKANRWIYDQCCTPAVLDYVEDLVGEDFYLWGCHFFCKLPGGSSDVPWHQDAQYWPLTPRETVTVWLAVYDTDDSNGAMRVVAGSHRSGMMDHEQRQGEKFVLSQGIDETQFDAADVVTIDLQAGQMSLHDDRLIHGSGPSVSGRRRVGLTMRFSPSQVHCDLSVWPNFEAYPMRGTDAGLNPVGKIPLGDACPTSMFQLSSEFA
jgi:hypothetical protein